MNNLIITGTLRFRTALHIGAGSPSKLSDDFLRRDATGEVFIPGSTLAGALRAVATGLAARLALRDDEARPCQALRPARHAEPERQRVANRPCGCPVCHLFGELYPQEQDTEAEGGRAARLWVSDARLSPMAEAAPSGEDPNRLDDRRQTHLRDGVGLSRDTRASARQAQAKFNLEALPAQQACFTLRLELEEGAAEDEQLLAAALAEWSAGRGRLGGRTAAGLGAFKLEGLAAQRRVLNTIDRLVAWLKVDDEAQSGALGDQPAWRKDRLAQARQRIAPRPPDMDWGLGDVGSWLEATLELEATSALLVNDPAWALRGGFDQAPFVEGAPLLPGSSLRGALRSQAERIARTLATRWAADSAGEDPRAPWTPEQSDAARRLFLHACPACDPLARPIAASDRLPLQHCDSLLALPAEEEAHDADLCLACRLWGSPRRASRLYVEDAAFTGWAAPEHPYKAQDHLAIDRFTGGGRDNAKFDALAAWRPRLTARLHLDAPQAWEVGWLLLTLRDLHDGLITVGADAGQGFGRLLLTGWRLNYATLHPSDWPLELAQSDRPAEQAARRQALQAIQATAQPEDSLYTLYTAAASAPQTANWATLAQACTAQFRAQVKGFNRYAEADPDGHGLLDLPADTYYRQAGGARLDELYPRRMVLPW